MTHPTNSRRDRRSNLVAGPGTSSSIDRARILGSRAFRRLQGVTQVLSDTTETTLLYTRLTHSLNVASIGLTIASNIIEKQPEFGDLIDPGVVEVAGLAHDLGHPPFGHVGEQTLDEVLNDQRQEGFEGNAQSFRIVTRLAEAPVTHQGSGVAERVYGLDLTRASLNAILKYPWMRADAGPKKTKWGAYRSDQANFQFARGGVETEQQALEAAIMDWADDIAYSIHDLTDFYGEGLIDLTALVSDQTMDDVTSRLGMSSAGISPQNLVDARGKLAELLPKGRFAGNLDDRRRMQVIAANLTDSLVQGTSASDNGHLRVDPVLRATVLILKEANLGQVIDRPPMLLTQEGQRRTLRELFEALLSWLESGRATTVMPLLAEMIEANKADQPGVSDAYLNVRIVADYISSLTDRESVQILGTLTGRTYSSVIGPWNR